MTNTKEYNQKYYADRRKKISQRKLITARKKKAYIQQYKIEKGCSICGYNKCARALELHHTNDDKEFTLARATWSRGWDKIKKEIKKCIVVCANCHAELHDNMASSSSGRTLDFQSNDEGSIPSEATSHSH